MHEVSAPGRRMGDEAVASDGQTLGLIGVRGLCCGERRHFAGVSGFGCKGLVLASSHFVGVTAGANGVYRY